MTNADWKKQINPATLNFGVVADKTQLPFEVANESELPFASYTRSCSCVGDIRLTDNGTLLTGVLEAKYTAGAVELLPYKGMFLNRIKTPGAPDRFMDMATRVWVDDVVEEEIGEPVKVTGFNQAITVYGVSDQPHILVRDTGEQYENQAIPKITIPVQMYILPPGYQG